MGANASRPPEVVCPDAPCDCRCDDNAPDDRRDRVYNVLITSTTPFSKDLTVGANLPMEVDLRTHPKMPPVENQQNVGSCTAFAVGAAFEFAYPYQGFRGSKLFIYFNERRLRNTMNEDSGAAINDGIKTFQPAQPHFPLPLPQPTHPHAREEAARLRSTGCVRTACGRTTRTTGARCRRRYATRTPSTNGPRTRRP